MNDDAAAEGGLDDIDPFLLSLLVCPQTKGPLHYAPESRELISARARVAYPVRDGVPIMLAEEARSLTEAEIARYDPR